MTFAPRHLLRDDDLDPAAQDEVLRLAQELKAGRATHRPLEGPRNVALLFDKPTLRTQVSFSAAITELGGFPMVVDTQLAKVGRREPVADAARVLGRQVAAVVWRTDEQADLEEMARHAGVPVVNALTDRFHPCQALADLLTIRERRGDLMGLRLTFLGDGACNMAHSHLLSGATAGMHVRVSGPAGYEPDADVLERAGKVAAATGGCVEYVADPEDAVVDADVLATDTWVSMGKEEESERRARDLTPYALTAELLDRAAPDALVLHCLPAHRGREVTAEVLDGPRSVVWDEAENRRHVQKAVLCSLLGTPPDTCPGAPPGGGA